MASACVGRVGRVAVGLNLDVGEGEGGVGEAETEFVHGGFVVAVEGAVVDEYSCAYDQSIHPYFNMYELSLAYLLGS